MYSMCPLQYFTMLKHLTQGCFGVIGYIALCLFPFSTLVIGGAGSLMLDLYGWESVFYVSGLLSVLWAYCMWKYLLKGEGKWGSRYPWCHCMLLSRSCLFVYFCIIVLLYAHMPAYIWFLQGLSSPSSPWEAVGPSPNCPRDTGYGSSNNLQSGEIKIKEACMCSPSCVRVRVCSYIQMKEQLYFCLSYRVWVRNFYYNQCLFVTS